MSKGQKTDTWYPFFVGDYRKDTGKLSCEQHGAYRQLIDEYWVTGPLEDDDTILARVVGLELRVWRKHRPVIARFFSIADGVWRHGRIDRELISASERKGKAEAKARVAAEARWGKPRASSEHAPGMLQALPEHMHEECPPPSPKEEKDADASFVGSDEPITTAKALWEKDHDFLSAWKACTEPMRTRSSRKAAHAAWRLNKAPAETKLNALRAYLAGDSDVQRTGGPGLHLWLRDKLPEWLDRGLAAQSASAPWPGDARIPPIMARAFGAEKGNAYLAAYCAWQDVPTPALLCSNNLICDFIRKEAGPDLEAIGVRVLLAERAA